MVEDRPYLPKWPFDIVNLMICFSRSDHFRILLSFYFLSSLFVVCFIFIFNFIFFLVESSIAGSVPWL